MADKDQDQTEAQAKPKSNRMMMIIVAVVAIAGGVATPLVFAKLTATPEKEFAAAPDKQKDKSLTIPEATEKVTLVDFEEVTVNLNENNFNRFIKVHFALQIAENQKVEIGKLLEERKAVLVNWLIGHLSDKRLNDIKGKIGHNRLRREIHDEFNALLFDDGVERIQDVLFKELHVQ